jgi:hypothetical protein
MTTLYSQRVLSLLAGGRIAQFQTFKIDADAIAKNKHTIIAMIDGYIDLPVSDGIVDAGTILFTLNDAELDLESFTLQQKKLLAGITADRLSEEYVQSLIISPLTQAIDLANQDYQDAILANDAVQIDFKAGIIATWSPEFTDNAGLVDQRNILLTKAQANLLQKQIEIDSQRRRLSAEMQDLDASIALNGEIKKLHQYCMPQKGDVQFETFGGAFLRKQDQICTIKFT